MNDTSKHPAACASCDHMIPKRACMNPKGVGATGCPTLIQSELVDKVRDIYAEPDIYHFAQEASRQEAHGYANRHERPYVLQPQKTRIQEICEFAEKMGYTRLGLAFCLGLSQEAAMVEKIFRNQGFDVVSVVCKAGRVSKETIGISDEDKIMQGKDEVMCNPIFQANVLNEEKTEFNVLLGLCVGHDSLFFKHAEAPTTVLAVKDRVTGHNPLAALYTSHSYYRKITVRPRKGAK